MESKLMLLCGLILIFCVTAISAELVAYPHVGCFAGKSISRYFNRHLRKASSVWQKGEDHVMRCFEAARAENFDIFAVSRDGKKIQCWTGRHAKKNLKKYQEGSRCKNGLGGQNSFDIYLVPGAETDSCQDLPDGEYQDSLFCNRFYTCMDGKATVNLCPMGLLFDPATRQCLQKVPCPRGEPCVYYDDGEYPHPSSCRKYLVCYKKQAFEAICPSYLWFNDDTKQCDSPGNTECSNDPCEDSTCLNGGTCMASQEEELKFKCTCKAGFTGTRCEVKVKPCSLHPCKNEGTCQELGDSTYVCKCKLRYGGQNCTEYCPGFEDSAVVGNNKNHLTSLSNWLAPVAKGVYCPWKRCWRASVDGWAASTFHSRCDGKGPTVTIIRVGKYIFGGYTSISWASSGGYQYDSKAFLFSLVNKPGWAPVKLPQTGGKYSSRRSESIECVPHYGPTFGGSDIYINNYASSNNNSFSSLGYTYSPPSGYSYKSTFARTFLAGTYHFTPDEVETFYETN